MSDFIFGIFVVIGFFVLAASLFGGADFSTALLCFIVAGLAAITEKLDNLKK